MSGKFIWGENELKIARTQCEFCKYYSKDLKNSCEKYDDIPEEILKNKYKCSYIKYTTFN